MCIHTTFIAEFLKHVKDEFQKGSFEKPLQAIKARTNKLCAGQGWEMWKLDLNVY